MLFDNFALGIFTGKFAKVQTSGVLPPSGIVALTRIGGRPQDQTTMSAGLSRH